jgi:alpha-tubulin suppressor-like RCC1 family protein
MVSEYAVRAHLAHGDSLGPCSDGAGAADGDGDGVANDVDACPDTPQGDDVYDDGCTVIVLEADAGPDMTAWEGGTITVTGAGLVLAGEYDVAELVFVWEQLDGPPTDYEYNSPALSVFTDGVVGELTFRLTVSTWDGQKSSSDDCVFTVLQPHVTGVASARWHSALHWEDNVVTPWGWNRYGQTGDGSEVRDAVSMDVSGTSTWFAKTDGTVWTFGTNILSNSSAPVQVAGVTDVVQVAALSQGAMFLKRDGSVWGVSDAANRQCELGDRPHPGETGVTGPIQIPDLPVNITAIAGGGYHTVALDAEGTAWVWGARWFGCTPRAVMQDVTAVSAGESNHCLFLLSDGSVWAMGFNLHGQLGNGTTVSHYSTPTEVLDIADVSAVAAGNRHSLFLKSDGTLWVAGWNHDCQLGLGPDAPVTITIPTQVDLLDVVHVAGGYAHSVAVLSDDSVWAWGYNGVGQLTGGTFSTLPTTVCTPTPIEFTGNP